MHSGYSRRHGLQPTTTKAAGVPGAQVVQLALHFIVTIVARHDTGA